MNTNRESMIAGLTEDLKPVRAITARDGSLLFASAFGISAIAVILYEGFWHGITAGQAAPFFWITSGLLLLLGLSSASAVITMASPRVGNRYDAPKWASAMVAVLPLAALISLLPHEHGPARIMADMYGENCFLASMATSAFTAAAMVFWLRRGAPVSLSAAGWFTGIAAGSLGSVAYGLTCSIDSMPHLGIWHVAPVVVSAVIGRLAVPHLVRW